MRSFSLQKQQNCKYSKSKQNCSNCNRKWSHAKGQCFTALRHFNCLNFVAYEWNICSHSSSTLPLPNVLNVGLNSCFTMFINGPESYTYASLEPLLASTTTPPYCNYWLDNNWIISFYTIFLQNQDWSGMQSCLSLFPIALIVLLKSPGLTRVNSLPQLLFGHFFITRLI